VRPRDRDLAAGLEARLVAANSRGAGLPGIRDDANRSVFLEQLVESIRRVSYISVIDNRQLSGSRANPDSGLFDPLKAAILHKRVGDFEEAFWLVFLSVHFGKHRPGGWRLLRDVYGALGSGTSWTWRRTSADPHAFRQWLAEHERYLKSFPGIIRHFGNHRKYQSLSAWSPTGTGAAVESYVDWISPPRTHQTLFRETLESVQGDSIATFERLYQSMETVISFGRTAIFDYLTMIGKLRLAPIEPDGAHIIGSTGPRMGASLLFSGSRQAPFRSAELDIRVRELAMELGLGMQVMEDALCNWQKSPSRFRPFRG